MKIISEKRVSCLEKDHDKGVFWPRVAKHAFFDSFCANELLGWSSGALREEALDKLFTNNRYKQCR